MKDYGFITFLFETMRREVFGTKVRMAKELDVTDRALHYNFQNLGCPKGGSIACEHLFLYCLEHGHSIDRLYERYLSDQCSKKGPKIHVCQLMTIHSLSNVEAA